MKLGRRRNYHKGRVAIRHYANQPVRLCLKCVLNVKALVEAFNQEKALVGTFSVIVQLHRLIVYGTRVVGTPGRGKLCTDNIFKTVFQSIKMM